MKRLIALAIVGVSGLALMAPTCVVTHESLTKIGTHDTFAGELRNDSGVNILEHRYRVAFLNSNGAVVETQTVDGCLRSLQNGASDFFSATSAQPEKETKLGLARMANAAEDPDFTVGKVKQGDIALSDITAARDEDTLTVTGTITNDDNEDLEDPAVCVVVWNDDDRVVTTGKDTTLDDLPEDDSADFTVKIDVPDDSDVVDHVDVWADGLTDDTPVAPVSEEDVEVNVTPAGTATSTSTPAPTATPTP